MIPDLDLDLHEAPLARVLAGVVDEHPEQAIDPLEGGSDECLVMPIVVELEVDATGLGDGAEPLDAPRATLERSTSW